MTDMLRVGVLLSGSGRTLQNLIDRLGDGRLTGIEFVAVGSNKKDAFGLERARKHDLDTFVEPDPTQALARLEEAGAELICLCGYLKLLPIPKRFEGRVLNIHPALLPKHGGPGYYGDRVHRAVLEARDSESGCTVHLCSDVYDDGPILVQKRVPVLEGDTPDDLAARVFEAECEAYPEAIDLWRASRARA